MGPLAGGGAADNLAGGPLFRFVPGPVGGGQRLSGGASRNSVFDLSRSGGCRNGPRGVQNAGGGGSAGRWCRAYPINPAKGAPGPSVIHSVPGTQWRA